MRLRHIAAAVAALFSVNLFAIEVLVAPADRDRLIKTRDGRQIRLNAGSELIRTDDGRLAVRRAPNDGERTAIAASASGGATKREIGGDRWIWFAGAEGAASSVSRKHSIDSNEINTTNGLNYETVEYEGEFFRTDGGSHNFTKDESLFTFAIVGGLKDDQEQNYYQLGYYINDDLDEIAFSAQFGFTSLAALDDSLIPYARLTIGASFEDGIGSLDADGFAFGGGVGATYILNPNIEIYGGADYIMRNFGSAAGEATKSGGGSITYGSVEREETETKLYIGARYLFR
ncbi:MAG: hypothetical protein LBC09_05710 [Helicobacteraceae bacterium]|jgi:hypothetical protein|nr:hypothetical protein [Helicobacteraceae bacterium]